MSEHVAPTPTPRPAQRHATAGSPKRPTDWAVGDRVLLKAEVNEAFREGTPIRMIVKDTSALPDAVVATVPGTVERGKDGTLRAVAEWSVTGRAKTRQEKLRLEFHAVGRGLKSSVGELKIRPARLVQVEIGAGGESCGAVTLKAGKRVYAVGTGRAVEEAAVAQGRRVDFEIPLDYRGVLTIEQGRVPLVQIDLSRVAGQDTIKLKLASAGRQVARPASVAPGWNRPATPPPPHPPRPVFSAPGAVPAGPFAGAPGGDAPLVYVCELPEPGALGDLVDGRLYTTDRASDAKLKKVHDTLIGVTTELLDKETLHALKLSGTKFTLKTYDGVRVLVVEGNRAIRKRLARIDAAVRTKVQPGEVELAQNLTRGASAGGRGIAQRSFLALKGKGAWLGVLIVGSAEALWNISQGASMLDVLDVFGMTVLKGALSMVLGTALMGIGIALGTLFFGAITIATGPLVIASIVVGIMAGILLDQVIPQSQLSELLRDVGDGAERWLHEFDEGLGSFRRWFDSAVVAPVAGYVR